MLRKATQVAVLYHRKLLKQPKMLFIACALFIIMDYLIGGVRQFCAYTGVSISLFGIVSMILSDARSSCLITLLFAFLLCDLPGWDEAEPYVLQRSGKYAWITGKILSVIFVSALYLAAVTACVLIILNRHISLAPVWGKAVNTLSQTDAAEVFKIRIAFSRKVIGGYTAMSAFGLSVGLFYSMFVCLGIWALYLNTITNKPIGSMIVAGLALVAVSIGGLIISGSFFKLSPVSLASLDIINPGYVPYRPTLKYSMSFYTVGTLIGIILLLCTSQRSIECQ